MTYLYRGKMIHGNKKYNFEPLKIMNGEITETTANIYALKSSLRSYFKGVFEKGIKGRFEFTEVEANTFHIKRIS